MNLHLTILAGLMNMLFFSHGDHLAEVQLTFSENQVELNFMIDAFTLDHLGEELFDAEKKKKKGLVLMNYINNNFEVLMNDSPTQFYLMSTDNSGDLFTLKATSKCQCNGEFMVYVSSNLFLEKDDTFESRVIIATESSNASSYRLTKQNNSMETMLKGL